MTRPKIAPSILTADFGHLADQVRAAEAGGVDLWHLDVMDGHFVPPLSFGKEVIAAVAAASDGRLIEAHMMVERPAEQFADLANAGAQRLIFHYEAAGSVEAARELILACRDLGCQAGIAINPETPVEAITPLLRDLDEVTVMLIRPGWGGQEMRPELLDKVRDLSGRIAAEGITLEIEVDGGVKTHNAASCASAGATILVAGSAIFNAQQTPQETAAGLFEALG
ncbi:MAG: ribulose-phosphate 3-epimerase [Chloroflexi bacterium]|nr:ribulose-phosphate 3-epimerase [Chloroflexota bacterium]